MIKNHIKCMSYDKAKMLIKEGDVLLFRGKGPVSFFIQRAGEGIHSHAAVASWHNGKLECVEFRECYGGRTTSLKRQVNMYPNSIDVFRPVNTFISYSYDKLKHKIIEHTIPFNGDLVTETMRQMTGLPYGWQIIWKIALHKFFGLRLIYNMDSVINDYKKTWIYPVCSTIVSYAFSSNNYDLVKYRSDEYTEPTDLARSARLSYLFTISP